MRINQKFTIILAISLVLCLLADFANARPRRWGGGSVDTRGEPLDEAKTYPREEALLKALNSEREKHGLATLKLDRELLLQTRQHCMWMAKTGRMVHSSNSGRENIAMGQENIEEVVSAWMNSGGHRANILSGSTITGVASYEDENGRTYWCEQFK